MVIFAASVDSESGGALKCTHQTIHVPHPPLPRGNLARAGLTAAETGSAPPDWASAAPSWDCGPPGKWSLECPAFLGASVRMEGDLGWAGTDCRGLSILVSLLSRFFAQMTLSKREALALRIPAPLKQGTDDDLLVTVII